VDVTVEVLTLVVLLRPIHLRRQEVPHARIGTPWAVRAKLRQPPEAIRYADLLPAALPAHGHVHVNQHVIREGLDRPPGAQLGLNAAAGD